MSEGSASFERARARYVEALAGRMAGQQDAVRRILEEKLEGAEGGLTARLADQQPAGTPRAAVRTVVDAACPPLVELNRSIRAAAPEQASGLASVQRFQKTWTGHRTQDHVNDALARKHANAGPINSHMLVLQSLDLMRGLSTAYLQRVLAQVNAMQWLEQAGTKSPQNAGQTAKTAKSSARVRTKTRQRPPLS
ncbi:MAG TPA: DUF2894 domain-containing protein [Ramlibacter sp.]|nr:DUF2894 domain-containing protein [Ramlibacter sp.]